MKLVEMAEAYLRQASFRLRYAGDALRAGNHPYALRLSQECVELSLKAALRLVGIEYPKVHDVSGVLMDHADRFPDWFRERLEFMAETSATLAAKREIAFYGGEKALLTPEEAISRGEAERALEAAEEIHNLCMRLLSDIKKGVGMGNL